MMFKKNKIWILLGASAPFLTMYSQTASALYCDPAFATQAANNTNQFAMECPKGKGAATFSGDASSYIKQFGTEIESAGKEIAEQIAANAASEISVIQEGNKNIIKTLVDITNTSIKDSLKQDKQLLDMKMEYMSELQERELKANQSVIGMDDTKEEVLFILSELHNVGNGSGGTYNHAQEVVAAMKAKYDDDPNFVMPVRMKSADSKMSEGEGCQQYDPDLHKAGKLDPSCFYAVKSSPGMKLEKYFQECSRVKRESMSAVQKSISTKAATRKQLAAQSDYAKKSSGGVQASQMAQSKVETQADTSCTPDEFAYKLCGVGKDGSQMTSKEYITKVIDNTVIPYGNVSSSNYLSPVSVGSIDGDVGDMSEEEIQSMRITAQQKLDAAGTPVDPAAAVSSNTPPLINTYRTSSQYYAAEDFVANIINREAISGLKIEDAKNSDKAVFHSKFMARSASLSLAENSLRQPIKDRMGTDLAAAVADGSLTREGAVNPATGQVEVLKEDLNGASSIDRLAFAINQDYARISNDAQSAASSGGTIGIETAAPSTLSEWQIESLVRTTQLLLMENEKNERMELLLATLLANTTNSKDNVDYINSFKYK